MPLEMHWRLMGLWRTTERSAGPVVRMDGGTRKMNRIEDRGIFLKTLYNSKFILKKEEKKKEITQSQRVVFTQRGVSLWLAFKA